MGIITNIEKKIANALIQEKHSDLEKEKIQFGLKIFFNELWKLIIVYIIASLLDSLLITFITHITFFALRQVALGFHFQNSVICLLSSILALPLSVYIIDLIQVNTITVFTLLLLSTIFLCIFAPAGTKKRPVFNENHHRYLKNKMYIRLFIIWIIILIVDAKIQKFMMFGMLLQTVAVLTQKIVGGNKNV